MVGHTFFAWLPAYINSPPILVYARLERPGYAEKAADLQTPKGLEVSDTAKLQSWKAKCSTQTTAQLDRRRRRHEARRRRRCEVTHTHHRRPAHRHDEWWARSADPINPFTHAIAGLWRMTCVLQSYRTRPSQWRVVTKIKTSSTTGCY